MPIAQSCYENYYLTSHQVTQDFKKKQEFKIMLKRCSISGNKSEIKH